MAEGARIAEAAGAAIIDINMGCPARHVTGAQSGSALMRDLDHALTLIEATVGAVTVPVTLKMRLGWDDRSINAPELARRGAGRGRAPDHGAWTHALPVLQRPRRLGRGARGQGMRLNSARGKRRHSHLRGRRGGAGGLGRRRGHDRARGARAPMAAGPDRTPPRRRPAARVRRRSPRNSIIVRRFTTKCSRITAAPSAGVMRASISAGRSMRLPRRRTLQKACSRPTASGC